jgi:pimeloyl-ACP methyl ester carboxylesterase
MLYQAKIGDVWTKLNNLMIKFLAGLLMVCFLLTSGKVEAQTDSIVLRDIVWDAHSPAGMTELFIPSGNALLAGFIYRANGGQKHPTLLLLHGYPGNERNLDLAQVVRAHGWNVIYFDYRGSWGSQGQFGFQHCVEDVVNVVAFCHKYQDSLRIDASNIVLFGHSMGGWICLKALEQLPEIKKGFALSTWDIYNDYKKVLTEKEMLDLANNPDVGGKYFVLNSSLRDIFSPVLKTPAYFNLANGAKALAKTQIVMLDEHSRNKSLAEALRSSHDAYFDYEVWPTDHPFTNKRVALIKKVLEFLDR